MPTSEELAQIEKGLEERFMQILSEPDVIIPAEEIDGELSEEQRATLQSVLEAEMPTPEEIQQYAEIAEHNHKVERERKVKLLKRKIRRITKGKKRKRGR